MLDMRNNFKLQETSQFQKTQQRLFIGLYQFLVRYNSFLLSFLVKRLNLRLGCQILFLSFETTSFYFFISYVFLILKNNKKEKQRKINQN